MKKHTIARYTALSIALLIGASAMAAPKQDKRFQRWDQDKDGSISVEELQAGMAQNVENQAEKKGWSDEEVAKRKQGVAKNAPKRLEAADQDGDGKLSPEEFAGMTKKKD